MKSFVVNRILPRVRHWSRLRIAAPIIFVALLLLLPACSGVGPSTQGIGHASIASSPTAPTPTGKLVRNTDGCPSAQAPASAAAFHADIVVSESSEASATQQVSATQGQRLEFHLSPSYQWQLTLSDPAHILTAATGEGWYDATLNACVWQFTATATGNAQLRYSGDVVCPYLETCPSDGRSASFAVTVRS